MKRIISLVFLFVALHLGAQTVYVTNTGEKYHLGSCHYLAKSKNAIGLSDAINQGYGACKVCKPPQTVSRKTEVKEEKQRNITVTQAHHNVQPPLKRDPGVKE